MAFERKMDIYIWIASIFYRLMQSYRYIFRILGKKTPRKGLENSDIDV